jgi:hypothetical protein
MISAIPNSSIDYPSSHSYRLATVTADTLFVDATCRDILSIFTGSTLIVAAEDTTGERSRILSNRVGVAPRLHGRNNFQSRLFSVDVMHPHVGGNVFAKQIGIAVPVVCKFKFGWRNLMIWRGTKSVRRCSVDNHKIYLSAFPLSVVQIDHLEVVVSAYGMNPRRFSIRPGSFRQN